MKTKNLFFAFSLSISFGAINAFSKDLSNQLPAPLFNPARVEQVITLEQNKNITSKVVVRDLGGSTDLSPTRQIYFALYLKGEMFDVEASFDLGTVFIFKSAKKISAGVYEVIFEKNFDPNHRKHETVRIDARQALEEMKKVRCTDNDDCGSVQNFKTHIRLF